MTEFLDPWVYSKDNSAFVDVEAVLDVNQHIKRLEFAGRLLPTPETERFEAEMDSPLHLVDEVTGIRYGVYQVNTHKVGEPLVMNLGWSVTAGAKPGRHEVKAFATHLDRPITVIDTEAHGETDIPPRSWRQSITFDEMAAAHLRIIDQLDISKFDIEGRSMGGILAAMVAERAGSRVGTLITMSTVSFEPMSGRELAVGFALRETLHQRAYMKQAVPAIRKEADGGFLGTFRNLSALYRYFMLMREEILPNVVQRLSPSTTWHDFVGSKEEVTNWQAHLQAVRQRNERLPHSSSLYVLGSESHAWDVYINASAEAVALTLLHSNSQPESSNN